MIIDSIAKITKNINGITKNIENIVNSKNVTKVIDNTDKLLQNITIKRNNNSNDNKSDLYLKMIEKYKNEAYDNINRIEEIYDEICNEGVTYENHLSISDKMFKIERAKDKLKENIKNVKQYYNEFLIYSNDEIIEHDIKLLICELEVKELDNERHILNNFINEKLEKFSI